ELLLETEEEECPSFGLFVDAIDEADDLDRLTRQLNLLRDSIGATSPEVCKVVLSCRDVAWSRFRQRRLAPLYEDAGPPPAGRSGYAAKSIWLSDFTTDELDRALQAI